MISEQVAQAVAAAAKTAFDQEITPEIGYPDPRFGDFATNAAFSLAKQLKRSPTEVAEQIIKSLKAPDIKSARLAGPGFINLVMNDQFWVKQLAQIAPDYVRNNSGQGQKTQVEFISANPTGPLTLANARGGFVGDVLARVLEANGHHVTREYYLNDSGNQITNLAESVKATIAGKPRTAEYQGEYIKELSDQLKRTSLSETGLVKYVVDHYLKPAVASMNIDFDTWFSEKELIARQAPDKILVRLKRLKLIKQNKGAVYLTGGQLGDRRQDRVLRKSNGDNTYLLNDLAYHAEIFEKRGFDRAIKVWGADHSGQVDSLRLPIAKLFPGRRLDFIILQMVRLIKHGKEIKISKRAGTYVTVDELLKEIPPEVARWFFLMRSANTHMDFDLDLAREQSQKNPFYYVMYAYTRAYSILAQAKQRGLKPGQILSGVNPHEKLLIRQLIRLPELVQDIATSYDVHQLTFYGVELARLFHDYYETERIIDLPKDEAEAKLYLVDRIQLAMEAYWKLLGITPKTRM